MHDEKESFNIERNMIWMLSVFASTVFVFILFLFCSPAACTSLCVCHFVGLCSPFYVCSFLVTSDGGGKWAYKQWLKHSSQVISKQYIHIYHKSVPSDFGCHFSCPMYGMLVCWSILVCFKSIVSIRHNDSWARVTHINSQRPKTIGILMKRRRRRRPVQKSRHKMKIPPDAGRKQSKNINWF